MIRDDEISRLIQYAEGLGLKVRFLSNQIEDAAAWVLDGSEIIINKKRNSTKIETILSLIHELGHHVWFIHEKNRRPDLKFEEALERQNLFEIDLADTPAPKHLRKKILDTEIAGTLWWPVIYKDTNLKFPMWRLRVAAKFDTWVYEVYYETGLFPTRKQGQQKYKELVNIWKKNTQ